MYDELQELLFQSHSYSKQMKDRHIAATTKVEYWMRACAVLVCESMLCWKRMQTTSPDRKDTFKLFHFPGLLVNVNISK